MSQRERGIVAGVDVDIVCDTSDDDVVGEALSTGIARGRQGTG
jgi:hypothetical protein